MKTIIKISVDKEKIEKMIEDTLKETEEKPTEFQDEEDTKTDININKFRKAYVPFTMRFKKLYNSSEEFRNALESKGAFGEHSTMKMHDRYCAEYINDKWPYVTFEDYLDKKWNIELRVVNECDDGVNKDREMASIISLLLITADGLDNAKLKDAANIVDELIKEIKKIYVKEVKINDSNDTRMNDQTLFNAIQTLIDCADRADQIDQKEISDLIDKALEKLQKLIKTSSKRYDKLYDGLLKNVCVRCEKKADEFDTRKQEKIFEETGLCQDCQKEVLENE